MFAYIFHRKSRDVFWTAASQHVCTRICVLVLITGSRGTHFHLVLFRTIQQELPQHHDLAPPQPLPPHTARQHSYLQTLTHQYDLNHTARDIMAAKRPRADEPALQPACRLVGARTLASEATDCREDLLRQLQLLHDDHKTRNDVFRVRAYSKVLQSLKNWSKPITSEECLKEIPGLAQKGSIRDRMVQIIRSSGQDIPDTKKVKTSPESDILRVITKIHGVGAVRAQQLVNTHGIRSLADLRAQRKLLNNIQLIGLDYYDDINTDIPRAETKKHEEFLQAKIAEVEAGDKMFGGGGGAAASSSANNAKAANGTGQRKMFGELTGSYRRGEKLNGDIDMVITAKAASGVVRRDAFATLLKTLEDADYITATLANSV